MTGSAMIIGAGEATGAAIARVFAERGLAVAVARRSAAAAEGLAHALKGAGVASAHYAFDAADEAAVIDAFERAEADLGPLKAVIHNAGIFARVDLAETGVEEFERQWRTNTLGGFLAVREAARRMAPRGEGFIGITGATASKRGGVGFSGFAASKFGLRAVAESAARELGPKGIHVAHVIVDGIIEGVNTERWDIPREKSIDPQGIADAFGFLYDQQPRNWTFELDLRPDRESW